MLVTPFLTALRNDISFRGSISVGHFFQNHDATLTVGPAVDKAAENYLLPNWIRVFTAPSATLTIEQFKALDLSERYFIKYDIPMKNGVNGID